MHAPLIQVHTMKASQPYLAMHAYTLDTSTHNEGQLASPFLDRRMAVHDHSILESSMVALGGLA